MEARGGVSNQRGATEWSRREPTAGVVRQASKMKNQISCLSLLLTCFCALCGECRAELPHIRLDRIFPLGGQASSTVLLEITGKDLDDVKALHFDHAGFKAEFVKPNQFRVTIAAETLAGT